MVKRLRFIRTTDRATRLVTPGDDLAKLGRKAALANAVTDSATENKPPAVRSTVASRRETCETSSNCSHRLVRVKRWGKSPPPRWQHRGHGKPRVVQGQIGGESWPGSLSGDPAKERTPFYVGASRVNRKPSGRLLESRCEPGPRGMIAAGCSAPCAMQPAQNPAYRPVRY